MTKSKRRERHTRTPAPTTPAVPARRTAMDYAKTATVALPMAIAILDGTGKLLTAAHHLGETLAVLLLG